MLRSVLYGCNTEGVERRSAGSTLAIVSDPRKRQGPIWTPVAIGYWNLLTPIAS